MKNAQSKLRLSPLNRLDPSPSILYTVYDPSGQGLRGLYNPGARKYQEEPARSQEEPKGWATKGSQDEPESARRSKEELGGARESQGQGEPGT